MFFANPQNDSDVTKLPCRIGTGDCEGWADGYVSELLDGTAEWSVPLPLL